MRRFSAREQEIVDEQVAAMLAAGAVQPSDSPWAAPVVLVTKKGGDIRFCVDYRALNARTARDEYPLPRVDDLLPKLRRCRVFTTLDLARGYWQVPLHVDSRALTAFRTSRGLFEFTVMPFGLTNAPASFQRAVDTVFKGLMGTFVFAFMDDIVVGSESVEDHPSHVAEALDRLRAVNFKVKAKKCHFGSAEVVFLGHLIGPAGISMEPAKVEAMAAMAAPTDVPGVRRIMGVFNYYRQFFKGFATVVEPINRLLRKNTPWSWGPSQDTAFTKLKRQLLTAPTMLYPDPTRPFTVETDASDVGVGAVVSQCPPGSKDPSQLRPVGFFSKTLNQAQRNYTTTERECLAVVWILRQQRHWFSGVPVTLYTDHSALQWLFAGSQPRTGRLERWIAELMAFDLLVRHRAGKDIPVADALSRSPVDGSHPPDDAAVPTWGGAPPATLPTPPGVRFCMGEGAPPVAAATVAAVLPIPATSAPVRVRVPQLGGGQGGASKGAATQPPRPEPAKSAAAATQTELVGSTGPALAPRTAQPSLATPELPSEVPLPQRTWPPDWAAEQRACAEGRKLVAEVEAAAGRVVSTAGHDYRLESGVVHQRSGERWKTWVPPHWRAAVIAEAHADHMGVTKTAWRTGLHLTWPRWYEDVRAYVRACDTCQRLAPRPGRVEGRRGALDSERPWQLVALDMAGPLARTPSGNRFVLLAVDHFTRYVIARAVKDASAATAAKFWVQDVVTRFGAPETLLTDKGSNFVAELFRETCRTLGTKRKLTTAYSPQGDARAERHIQIVKRVLKKLEADGRAAGPWDELLPVAVLAHNSTQHSATGESPHFLVHGVEPRTAWAARPAWPPLDPQPGETPVEAHVRRLLAQIQRGAAAAAAAQQRLHTAPMPRGGRTMPVGSSVLLWRPHRYPGGHGVTGSWEGPFRVQEAPTPETRRIHAGVGDAGVLANVRRLRPYRHGAEPPEAPPADAVEPLSPAQELAEGAAAARARSTGSAWLRSVTDSLRRAVGR